MKKIQEATKKETIHVAAGTGAGMVLMFLGFGILHVVSPTQVPFDYKVITGGLAGGVIAVSNFFLMSLAVQKVAGEAKEDRAYQIMKASYSQRMLLQVIWIILALVLPCFNGVAGILPLLFPSLFIKVYYGFLSRGTGNAGTQKQVTEEGEPARQEPAQQEERGDSE